MDFIKRFGDRRPEYAKVYRETIINRFTQVGGRDEEGKYESGKYFSNVYELFMYAVLLGLRRDYRIPIIDMDTSHFIEIRSWQPREMVHFLLLSLLAKSNIDLNALEEMEDKQVETEITGLNRLMEEYANGGLDIIQTKLKEDPYFFGDDYCFVNLLEE